VVQPSLIIGDEDDGGDVHRIDEGQSRLHPLSSMAWCTSSVMLIIARRLLVLKTNSFR